MALLPADQAVETEDGESPHLCHSITCSTSQLHRRRGETLPVVEAWPLPLCFVGGGPDKDTPTTRNSSYKQSESVRLCALVISAITHIDVRVCHPYYEWEEISILILLSKCMATGMDLANFQLPQINL